MSAAHKDKAQSQTAPLRKFGQGLKGDEGRPNSQHHSARIPR
jgi:hypothetical protein